MKKKLTSYCSSYILTHFCAFLFFSNTSWSQEIVTTRDIGVWLNIGVNYKFNKHWNIALTPSLRTFDNASKIKSTLVDLEVDYRINKNFKLGAGGRYDYARKNDFTFTNDIRYSLDIEYKTNFSEKFEFKYRMRYQHKYINLFTFNPEVEENSNFRNRLKMSYNFTKHSLYFSAELFRKYEYYQKPKFNNLRISLGDEFKIFKSEIDIAIAYERQLNNPYPLNFFFLNLGYCFKLKKNE